MTLPVSTEDVLEPQAAMNNRSRRRLNARTYLDMIFEPLMKQRPTHVTRRRATPLLLTAGNSDEKAHYGLEVFRSEERGVECKRDSNTEEGYLPNLNEEISAVTRLMVGQMMDESRWLGLLTVAEAAIRSNQCFHSANN